jgi:hypothetical protein
MQNAFLEIDSAHVRVVLTGKYRPIFVHIGENAHSDTDPAGDRRASLSDHIYLCEQNWDFPLNGGLGEPYIHSKHGVD